MNIYIMAFQKLWASFLGGQRIYYNTLMVNSALFINWYLYSRGQGN